MPSLAQRSKSIPRSLDAVSCPISARRMSSDISQVVSAASFCQGQVLLNSPDDVVGAGCEGARRLIKIRLESLVGSSRYDIDRTGSRGSGTTMLTGGARFEEFSVQIVFCAPRVLGQLHVCSFPRTRSVEGQVHAVLVQDGIEVPSIAATDNTICGRPVVSASRSRDDGIIAWRR